MKMGSPASASCRGEDEPSIATRCHETCSLFSATLGLLIRTAANFPFGEMDRPDTSRISTKVRGVTESPKASEPARAHMTTMSVQAQRITCKCLVELLSAINLLTANQNATLRARLKLRRRGSPKGLYS